MNREEKNAETYFKSIGFEKIKFEPNGNRTPDFLINNQIAVEVRRLNQFHYDIPLEKVTYNLIPRIINQIESYGDGSHKSSAFIGITYLRPIKYNKEIKEKINSILKSHSLNMGIPKAYKITDNLEIDIFPSEKKLDVQYHFGSSTDFNEGGFVLNNIYNSLKLIVKEKKEKVQPFRSDYDIWWLALIDNIGNGLSKSELKQLRNSIDFDLNFDKIFIISNTNPIVGGEL
ncbi:hypothetical protein [Winogradskyella sp. SYSU M77433]|uniref:hypothetical protein n=1 Tax=Winogradskyella sp. SYSU M77433 TaxID=3042722 RepID=UPI002480CCF1|nr:hypothetical protein [Winogradskyella sp. SYSU M77433]MDH7914542.1 hypothetical protein [Winogradskyella sp. SYSU M77433]